MVSGATTIDEAAVLAAARRFRRDANAAEAGVLAKAVEWAHLHMVEDVEDAATLIAGGGQDTGIPIAGEGCPLVSEFAVVEFATALGLPQGSGRGLVGQALELAHRLPRVWARVQDGSLAPWRARRIAEKTLPLSPEAAGFVDRMVAPFAHRVGPAQTDRLVDEAIGRFMPALAAQQRDRSAEQRYFAVDHTQVSFAGTTRVHGELDLADALDLDDAVTAGAAQLSALGNTESLDVRRSLALGMIARGDQALVFPESDGETDGFEAPFEARRLAPQDKRAGARTSTTGGRCTGREVVLFVHLSDQAIRSHDPDLPVIVEHPAAGVRLVTAGQVADWCGRADTTRVTVKPVLDLNQRLSTGSCVPPARLAEQVRVRDRVCVFPHCTRPARSCDADHIEPFDSGGATATDNLASLCRLHHRIKTRGGWTYAMVEPGVFLWHSPYGYSYLVDPDGTDDLTPKPVPPPVDPPGR